ncbi:hypothetical protein THRCLA_08803 [Thraustotheca clavata]|uniref:Uncharacterized protein n=1 Tax=Thraustotheca clavata TaxID=74557 RepID=A0A1V9Z230_9STRA|nr:hypothetical protein THRCLA_08803 [Thraustotheca clavata]
MVRIRPPPGILPIFREPPPTEDERELTDEDVLSLPIWYVNPADPKQVSPLTTTAAPLIGMHGSKPEDILKIARCLLSLNMPTNCIENILEFTGLFIEYRVETFVRRRVYAPVDEEYLRCVVTPLKEKELELARPFAIVLEIVSHDQGWATNEQNLNGTYNGCWSWAEGQVLDTSENKATARFPVCYNLRALSTSRRHIQCVTDPLILQELKMGSAVTLQLRAEYAGWVNEANYGRISILFVAGLNI